MRPGCAGSFFVLKKILPKSYLQNYRIYIQIVCCVLYSGAVTEVIKIKKALIKAF